ncbi:MAG: hypothetical protein ABFE08_03935 [Armatimonadia bacterium]
MRVALPLLLLALIPASLAATPVNFGLWNDPALAQWSPTNPASLVPLLTTPDTQVVTISTADLLDPATLSADGMACLVIPYAAYPAAGREALDRFLKAGGDLMLLGGDAFAQPLYRVGDRWLPLASFGPVQQQVTGPQQWDLSHKGDTDQMTVTGEGTAAKPYVFTTENLVAFQYAGLSPTLAPQTAGLVFEARGGPSTALICLEAREQDGSRWKQVVPLESNWREVRIHLASFCAYASKDRGKPGDYLHPEKLSSLYFGLVKSMVTGGQQRLEIRNLRFEQAAVSPAAATAAGIPLPGRALVEKTLGEAVVPGPAGRWPRLFGDLLEGPLDLETAPDQPLLLQPVRLRVTGAQAVQAAPTYGNARLFPEANLPVRFMPIITAPTRPRQTPLAAITAHLGGPQAGSLQFALGLPHTDLAAPQTAPLRDLIKSVAHLMATGAFLGQAAPRFVPTNERLEAVVFEQPVYQRQIAEAPLQLRTELLSRFYPKPMARTVPVPAAEGKVTSVECWSRLKAFDWRNFTHDVSLIRGSRVVDEAVWRVDAKQALRDLCDFLAASGADDGKFSKVYFIDSRGARTLLAGYEIFQEKSYRIGAIKWAKAMIAEQRPDGGYRMGYGITSRGEECYVADGGEIALGMARVAAYADAKDRRAIQESLRAYFRYREDFRCEGGGIGVGWCLTDYGSRPLQPGGLKEPKRIMAPELNTYTITCTLGAAWTYATMMNNEAERQATVRDEEWLRPRIKSLGGAAAESYMLAHLLAPNEGMRKTYAEVLKSKFIDNMVGQETAWWLSGGGRSALNLAVLAYYQAQLGPDPRVEAQMARATGAMAARQSPTSIYHLLGRTDLNHDEWLYLCFGGLGLAEVVEPGVTLKRMD